MRREALVLLGGGVFAGAAALIAVSNGFWTVLVGLVLLAPASGAFVSLSQASLVDHDPSRAEQNMARWTLAGSVGVLAGTLAIAAATSLEVSWRLVFLAAAVAAAFTVILARRMRIGRRIDPVNGRPGPEPFRASLKAGIAWALRSFRSREVVRWLVLLELSDLLEDILLGYLALYLVDVGAASPIAAAFGVSLWTGAGLAGGLLVVLLLERVGGLTYLRLSAVASLALFPAFLLVPDLWTKLLLAGAMALVNAGQYAVLQAQLYNRLPGRSASILALKNVSGLAGNALPLAVGAAAAAWGLGNAMWLLLAGPVAVILGTPGQYLATQDAAT